MNYCDEESTDRGFKEIYKVSEQDLFLANNVDLKTFKG